MVPTSIVANASLVAPAKSSQSNIRQCQIRHKRIELGSWHRVEPVGQLVGIDGVFQEQRVHNNLLNHWTPRSRTDASVQTEVSKEKDPHTVPMSDALANAAKLLAEPARAAMLLVSDGRSGRALVWRAGSGGRRRYSNCARTPASSSVENGSGSRRMTGGDGHGTELVEHSRLRRGVVAGVVCTGPQDLALENESLPCAGEVLGNMHAPVTPISQDGWVPRSPGCAAT